MITTDKELQGTQERIAYFERLLGQLRATATPAEFGLMAGGYRAELEQMQAEVVTCFADLNGSGAGLEGVKEVAGGADAVFRRRLR